VEVGDLRPVPVRSSVSPGARQGRQRAEHRIVDRLIDPRERADRLAREVRERILPRRGARGGCLAQVRAPPPRCSRHARSMQASRHRALAVLYRLLAGRRHQAPGAGRDRAGHTVRRDLARQQSLPPLDESADAGPRARPRNLESVRLISKFWPSTMRCARRDPRARRCDSRLGSRTAREGTAPDQIPDARTAPAARRRG